MLKFCRLDAALLTALILFFSKGRCLEIELII